MRVLNALRFDMLFQLRHGFYFAYLLLTAIFVLALQNLPAAMRAPAATLLLFADLAPLGFFFIGALVLLEKGQQILDSLFVTPLRLYEYMLAKIISLVVLSLLSATAVVLLVFGPVQNALFFVGGIVLSACFYTLFGLWLVARARHVNDYFVKALGVGLPMCLPVLGHLHLFETPLFKLFPTSASLVLIEIAFQSMPRFEIVAAFVCLAAWTVLAALLAHRAFYKHIILKIGAAA